MSFIDLDSMFLSKCVQIFKENPHTEVNVNITCLTLWIDIQLNCNQYAQSKIQYAHKMILDVVCFGAKCYLNNYRNEINSNNHTRAQPQR